MWNLAPVHLIGEPAQAFHEGDLGRRLGDECAPSLFAVQVAIKDQMDLSMNISLGSSLQIALFVAPVLVFISLLFENKLLLVFNNYELIAMSAASFITALVALDGESNWFEGAMLLAIYLILALAFFVLPGAAPVAH